MLTWDSAGMKVGVLRGWSAGIPGPRAILSIYAIVVAGRTLLPSRVGSAKVAVTETKALISPVLTSGS